MPADTDALARRPSHHALTDGVNRAGHFMSRHAGVLNTRPLPLLHKRITVANAASRDLDANRSRHRLGNRPLDNFKVPFCAGNLRYTHRIHDLMNSSRSWLI